MPKLSVVLTSTREGRAGGAVAQWFFEKAKAHGHFEVELIDLKEVNLPAMSEPNHPMRRQYQHDHTKAWSARVAGSDAFVFVTPEYNYGMPPALLNALDYLYFEWNYKTAGFVSYGGVSAGTRSVQHAKGVLPALKLVPIPEGVAIPFFTKLIDGQGKFDPGDTQDKGVKTMLDELGKWTGALAGLRK